ncbi:MAG: 3-deoxy-7-phosphoheptulonate synthase [Myxococcaceae bacterium]
MAHGHEAKKVLRRAGEETVRVQVGRSLMVGDGSFSVFAGPCALENAETVEKAADAVRRSGAHVFRGGAFKPRTSPYSFQGLGEVGLQLLAAEGKKHRVPVVSEVMETSQIALMVDYVDMLQIGARNMQNFPLLREVAKAGKPVLLKRGFGATLEEWLLAAEYLLDGGTDQVVLCERGIRSFDTTLRNTLDLAGMAWIKERSKLPVIVDPSHSTGQRSLVIPMALAAAAAGADGVMVEVHPSPEHALCDGPQALTPELFQQLMAVLPGVLAATGRKLAHPEALTAVAGGAR